MVFLFFSCIALHGLALPCICFVIPCITLLLSCLVLSWLHVHVLATTIVDGRGYCIFVMYLTICVKLINILPPDCIQRWICLCSNGQKERLIRTSESQDKYTEMAFQIYEVLVCSYVWLHLKLSTSFYYTKYTDRNTYNKTFQLQSLTFWGILYDPSNLRWISIYYLHKQKVLQPVIFKE